VHDLRLIRAVCALALVLFGLTACGGGDAVSVNPGTATANDVGSTTAATATISGTPMTGITVGTQYSFTPTASDSDGGTLAFSIQNPPSWASFDTTTGRLSGSPKITDTGTTLNIVITATDGTAKASLAAFSITVTATPVTPGTATVSWVAPTENVNGTALTDLAGFNVYYGTNSASLNQKAAVSNAGATAYTVNGLTTGTWYFAVTSYTSDGVESARSPLSSKTIS
jgi:Putative Ig domain